MWLHVGCEQLTEKEARTFQTDLNLTFTCMSCKILQEMHDDEHNIEPLTMDTSITEVKVAIEETSKTEDRHGRDRKEDTSRRASVSHLKFNIEIGTTTNASRSNIEKKNRHCD